MSNSNDDAFKLFCLAIVGIPCILGYAIYWLVFHNVDETKKILENVANSAKHGLVVNRADAWGQPIKVSSMEYSNAVDYIASSAGKDKTFNTSDDLEFVARDYKKTKIASEWAGRKAKETAKGFVRGLFE